RPSGCRSGTWRSESNKRLIVVRQKKTVNKRTRFMELTEFINDQRQLLDDFSYHYTRRRNQGLEDTMFHPESYWIELLTDFLNQRTEGKEDGTQKQDQDQTGLQHFIKERRRAA